uniref:Aminopeptidase N n=1 Tax=Schizaphis graminum TaxID=13262 RepID=A0A2S2NMY5_SCHGA
MVRYASVTLALFFAAAAPRHLRDAAGQSNDLSASYHSSVADGLRAAAAAGYETVAAAAAAATNGGSAAPVVYRLPAGVTPVSYELRVDTDLDRLSYSGSVQIAIVSTVTPKLCRIVLNAKDVRVTAVRVTDVGTGAPLTVGGWRLADGDEQLIVTVDGHRCLIPARRYAVDVDFQAPLRGDMSGYYRSSYIEGDVTKYIITYRPSIVVVVAQTLSRT